MIVMARFLGIDAPVNMIFFLGFCFSLVIIYTLTVSLSRMATKMRKLTQIIALNEDRIKALEQKLEKKSDSEATHEGQGADEDKKDREKRLEK